ncbi:hypothetical protein VNI00_017144 [Paramarasmius palmivorus]|uniref:Uncharacterized protein n=1 Tax=Paramarasmius palmivorus TaxID=297713 RepID=A0AAW0B9R0_9AGAR
MSYQHIGDCRTTIGQISAGVVKDFFKHDPQFVDKPDSPNTIQLYSLQRQTGLLVFIVEVMKKVSASVKSSKINFGKPTGGVAMVAAAVDHPFRHFEANSINSTVAMVPFTAGTFSTTIGGYVKYLSNFSDNWWNHLRELYDFEPTIPLHPLTLQIHWDLDGAAFTYLLVQSKPSDLGHIF